VSSGGGLIAEVQQEEIGAEEARGVEIAARSPLQLMWTRFKEDRVALVALGFVVLLVLVAVFAPLVVRLLGVPPPGKLDKSTLDSFGTPTGPSADHLFGVDPLGRDVLARTIYGARVSLEVAIVSTAIATVIGVVLGMFAGFYRGWADTLISRFMDVLLAFPVLLLAIGLASACSFGKGCLAGAVQPIMVGLVVLIALVVVVAALRQWHEGFIPRRRALRAVALAIVGGVAAALLVPAVIPNEIEPGLPVVIVVIAFVSWPYLARLVRGQVLSLREKEFVEASRSLGAANARIVFRELLPNLWAPIIVYATLVIPTNVLFEAALSFLGVGVQAGQPSWGAMLSDATGSFDTAWWYMVFPGVALVLTVLAFNLVGDALSDALNPRRTD